MDVTRRNALIRFLKESSDQTGFEVVSATQIGCYPRKSPAWRLVRHKSLIGVENAGGIHWHVDIAKDGIIVSDLVQARNLPGGSQFFFDFHEVSRAVTYFSKCLAQYQVPVAASAFAEVLADVVNSKILVRANYHSETEDGILLFYWEETEAGWQKHGIGRICTDFRMYDNDNPEEFSTVLPFVAPSALEKAVEAVESRLNQI